MKALMLKFAGILMLLIVVSYFGSVQLTQEGMPKRSTKPVVVAVLFNGDKLDGGWNEAQYRGFEGIADEMNVRLVYREHVQDKGMDAVAVIDELVDKESAEIVFAESYDYGPALREAARRHPKVKFFHVAGDKTALNLDTYFGRIYQARYLSGIVAGLQTTSNHIGFVAAFPIPEVIRGINAFTLGVRSVNPAAVVHVRWSGTWNDGTRETQTTNELLDAYPIDVLAQHQNTIYPMQAAQLRGVQVIGYNVDHSEDFPDVFLTAPVWNWGPFYRERLQECFEGRFKEKAFFEDYQQGVFDIAPLSKNVKAGAEVKVDEAREKMRSGKWDVFYGPVYDQQGNLRIHVGENISDQELLGTFDWFVEGVDGNPRG